MFIVFRWFKLLDKNGKEGKKERGELEVKISFIVKAGSLSDLSKKGKHKSSLGQLSQAFGKTNLIYSHSIILFNLKVSFE